MPGPGVGYTSVRLARDVEDDAAAFCALSNSLYARPVDSQYYRWQFFQTPFPSVLLMATEPGGALVGCYGVHVKAGSPGGGRIAWAIDIMVTPAYQGRGLFRKLAEFATRTVLPHKPVALCVISNERAEAAHVHGLGWHRVRTLRTFLCSISQGSRPRRDELTFERCENFEACGEVLRASREARGSLALFRNERACDYLNWRFLRNPRYTYELFLCRATGKALGYLVLKIFRDPGTGEKCGDIVDAVWTEEDPAALDGMLRFALGRFDECGLSRAAMWLETNSMMDVVGEGVGFVASEQRRFLCCRVLDRSYRWLEEPGRWFLSMADSEVY